MSNIIPNPALLPPSAGASAPPPAATPATGGGPPARRSPMSSRQTATVRAGPTFSKHALDRLAQRGIDVNGQTLSRLTDGLARAASKGSRNSVVFVDGTAFVASVQNNTVITAVTPEHMREHVFTNIDSAVIA